MLIVHISADYPDEIDSDKTRAISQLIELLEPDLESFVYSINRAWRASDWLRPLGSRCRIEAIDMNGNSVAVRYTAPPLGISFVSRLERLADWICADIRRRGLRPDLIQGHKLTIEGVIAARVGTKLGLPYAITAQGNTDQKIIKVRPDLHRLFSRTYHGAAVVIRVTPWIDEFLQERFGPRNGASQELDAIIPCPTTADAIIAPRICGPKLMSAFKLADSRNKNAARLIRAFSWLARQVRAPELSIYGGGSAEQIARLRRRARRAGGEGARVEPFVPHDQIQQRMNASAGFVLASYRETFGLVFSEALLAGCPVAYPKGAAIEGYFDSHRFAIPVDPRDETSIAEGMLKLVRNERDNKAELLRWQSSGEAIRFQRRGISAAYSSTIRATIRQKVEPRAAEQASRNVGAPPEFSVVIPAHNEEQTIERCLSALLRPEGPLKKAEILVVCNGCTDETASKARRFSPRVRVLEIPQPSKPHAINAGLAASEAPSAIVLDADVVASPDLIEQLAAALRVPGVMAASPVPMVDTSGADSWVRAYYRAWLASDYVRTGVGGSGIYGLSEQALCELGRRLPIVKGDDEFVRRRFPLESQHRLAVGEPDGRCFAKIVSASSLSKLVRLEARWQSGNRQLTRLFPEAPRARPPAGQGGRPVERISLADAAAFKMVKMLGRALSYWQTLRPAATWYTERRAKAPTNGHSLSHVRVDEAGSQFQEFRGTRESTSLPLIEPRND